jgi:hypothetical protein
VRDGVRLSGGAGVADHEGGALGADIGQIVTLKHAAQPAAEDEGLLARV